MDVLHYLNVLIGFSLVMLIFSIAVSTTSQAFLTVFKIKERNVRDYLTQLLLDSDFSNESEATQFVESILSNESVTKHHPFVSYIYKFARFLYPKTPKNIGREEFLLLLLRKAVNDGYLAKKLGFGDKNEQQNLINENNAIIAELGASEESKTTARQNIESGLIEIAKKDAVAKLESLEKTILREEVATPESPANLWRTKAMSETIPDQAAKIFSRFDDLMERIEDDTNFWGKFFSIIIALIILSSQPIDSIKLLNRLNNDKTLSTKLAMIAESNIPKLDEKLSLTSANRKECLEIEMKFNKMREDLSQASESEHIKKQLEECQSKQITLEKDRDNLVADITHQINNGEMTNLIPDSPMSFKHFFNPGVFITWILVCMGSAFWLGVLNKMLGIRSEFGKKLEEQRISRSNNTDN